MGAVDDFDWANLACAVRCWTGWGESASPAREDKRVIGRFGQVEGERLLGQVKRLEVEFYLSDAHVVATDIVDMAKRCARDFRLQHPGVPDEIVDAFVWCYTFDYR